ncbi:CRISPR-associated endonuclease Cas1 [Candidatus Woesearchaeota archaeon]|nr:CRISPR-associated endonuclease Cas1 [Candidatus Woesearchaeota archaeon]
MPKRNFYITKSGTIKRKHNTVWFENEKIKKAIPLNNIDSIYCLGQVSINSKLLTYLTQNKIIMHFFNYYGYYSGTYFPRKSLVSGSLVVKQVEHYKDKDKRLFIAGEIVKSTLKNLIRILKHYRKHKKKHIPYNDLEEIISKIPTNLFCFIITGSYTENKQTKKSDIDIVILCKDNTKEIYAELSHACEMNIPKIHLYVFTEEEFKQMLVDKKPNYGKEIVKNSLILTGSEIYLRIIMEAIEHGFNG